MRQAASGDTISLHYTGKLDDGSVFDSSVERDEPIRITLGGGEIIPGLESALLGMAEGESRDITLAPADAYGPHDPGLVHTVERDTIPDDIPLEVGSALQAEDPGGNVMHLTVVALEGDDVTLDANHPLAGKALTFELTLVGFAA